MMLVLIRGELAPPEKEGRCFRERKAGVNLNSGRSPWLWREQEPSRGPGSRSLRCAYVSSDLMLWQALCACFPTLFSSPSSLSSLRDYLDYSGKTSEGNHETGRAHYRRMSESVALS